MAIEAIGFRRLEPVGEPVAARAGHLHIVGVVRAILGRHRLQPAGRPPRCADLFQRIVDRGQNRLPGKRRLDNRSDCRRWRGRRPRDGPRPVPWAYPGAWAPSAPRRGSWPRSPCHRHAGGRRQKIPAPGPHRRTPRRDQPPGGPAIPGISSGELRGSGRRLGGGRADEPRRAPEHHQGDAISDKLNARRAISVADEGVERPADDAVLAQDGGRVPYLVAKAASASPSETRIPKAWAASPAASQVRSATPR